MESRIKDLLEKYWAGESTLQEEAELKAYYREHPSLTSEGKYFRELRHMQSPAQVKFSHPAKAGRKARWSVAAAVTVGVLAAMLIIEDARQQRQFVVEDPQEAYEITRKALLMVSSGLNEGKSYSKELVNINKAQVLITEGE